MKVGHVGPTKIVQSSVLLAGYIVDAKIFPILSSCELLCSFGWSLHQGGPFRAELVTNGGKLIPYKGPKINGFAWCYFTLLITDTPPKFNIAPEKWWLEDYFPIGKVTFQGLC